MSRRYPSRIIVSVCAVVAAVSIGLSFNVPNPAQARRPAR
jgi:hypothetical protein